MQLLLFNRSAIYRHFTGTAALAWSFVAIWGAGYLASKVGLQYAAPLTFLSLRFGFGLVVLVPLLMFWHRQQALQWPTDLGSCAHVVIAGLLMHGLNLGGSHYAQYLGMSAGVTALVLATQPLLTAVLATVLLQEPLRALQWLGVLLGLLGVGLVVAHKFNLQSISAGAAIAVLTSLVAITSGTLYQKIFCADIDLRTASLLQFGTVLALLLPLAWWFDGLHVNWSWPLLAAVAFLVIFSSIFAVNLLHTMMRQGQAARVTSLLYLTPIVAVLLERLLFGVQPTALTLLGIAVTCLGVFLVARPRLLKPRSTQIDPAAAPENSGGCLR